MVNELLTVVLICLFKRSRATKDSYISVTTCFDSVIGFLHSIRNDECTMLRFDGRKFDDDYFTNNNCFKVAQASRHSGYP